MSGFAGCGSEAPIMRPAMCCFPARMPNLPREAEWLPPRSGQTSAFHLAPRRVWCAGKLLGTDSRIPSKSRSLCNCPGAFGGAPGGRALPGSRPSWLRVRRHAALLGMETRSLGATRRCHAALRGRRQEEPVVRGVTFLFPRPRRQPPPRSREVASAFRASSAFHPLRRSPAPQRGVTFRTFASRG